MSGASRVHLGELLAAFGSILDPFPPPGGGPGEAPGGHFLRFCERCSPRGKKIKKIHDFLLHFG